MPFSLQSPTILPGNIARRSGSTTSWRAQRRGANGRRGTGRMARLFRTAARRSWTRPECRVLDLLMVWLSEPFGMFLPTDPQMRATVTALRDGLRLKDGLYRGLVRSAGDEPWLHQNALLAAYLYGAGDRSEAE